MNQNKIFQIKKERFINHFAVDLNNRFDSPFVKFYLIFINDYFLPNFHNKSTSYDNMLAIFQYSMHPADNLNQFLENLDFYAQAIVEREIDYTIFKKFRINIINSEKFNHF